MIAGKADVAGHDRYPGAVTLFACDFEEDADADFDGWPNGWLRRKGTGYPHYLKSGVSREPSARGAQCFRFNLDGGAAAVSSPAVLYDAGSEYVIDAAIKTVDLKHDEAYVAVRFDREGPSVADRVEPPGRKPTRGTRFGSVRCFASDRKSCGSSSNCTWSPAKAATCAGRRCSTTSGSASCRERASAAPRHTTSSSP